MNDNVLKQVLELLERDERLVWRSSDVLVHSVFDAELVRQQVEVGNSVQDNSRPELLCKPAMQSHHNAIYSY